MIEYDRLLKLADYIEFIPASYTAVFTGGRRAFDFGIIRSKWNCGTVGCAIGFTPEVFPDLVEVDEENALPKLKTLQHPSGSIYEIGRELFGLNKDETAALFVPDQQRTLPDVPLRKLDTRATGRMVAENIRTFVRVKKATQG